MSSDLGSNSRGSIQDVYAVPGITFDLDLLTWGAHKKSRLPRAQEDAITFIEGLQLPQPTAWIHSGNGLYPRWHFDQIFIIGDDDDDAKRERIERLTESWHAYIRQRALEDYGWHFDNTGDLARLTRHSGTFNHKNPRDKKAVRLLNFDPERTYSIEELEAVLSNVRPEESASDVSVSPTAKVTTAAQSSSAPPAWKQHCLGLKPGSDKNFESVYEGCYWMRRGVDDAASLSEPEWYAALSISARCENGKGISHVISEPHPEYSARETDQKIKQALDSAGPRTCKSIQQSFSPDACKACPFRQQINTPLELADAQPQAVALMKDYVYVIKTGQFFNLSTLFPYAYSEKGFNSSYAHWRLKDSPANSLLRSPACRKVREIGYHPGNPDRLVVDGYGLSTINTWNAPTLKVSDASPEWLIQHLQYLIPIEAEHDHVINVLAHLVQKPSIKITHGLLIIGKQGTGKTFLGDVMQHLLESSNVQELTSDDIESRWNAKVGNHVLAIVEEMMVSDCLTTYNRMKPWLSNETMQCEEKQVPRYQAKTPRLMIGLSNHQTPTKIANDDRRWFVVNSPVHGGDKVGHWSAGVLLVRAE